MASPSLTRLRDAGFGDVCREIEAFPRLCGYYITGFVSLRDFRRVDATQDAIIDAIYDCFDDDPMPADPANIPTDQSWEEYETSAQAATPHAIAVLVGGSSIGHTVDAMSTAIASSLCDRFVTLCGQNPRFYVGLGLGNREYVFQHGVLVVADEIAGLLWVVESD